MSQDLRRRTAIVVGGSLAGLLAARVLSDHYARVVVVERHPRPGNGQPRHGAPQAHHAHGLLNGGWRTVSRLFPDLESALRDAGAPWLDMGEDVRWHHFGGWKVRFRSGITGPLITRPFFQSEIARRVSALPNVTTADDCTATGLTTTADRRRVTGVRVQRSGGVPDEDLHADLVVDASGRGSQLPQWLDALGYERPEESELVADVGYATRLYTSSRRPEELPKALLITPRPPATRGAALFRIEGNRYLLTLMGWVGDHPPTDEGGFLEFADTLPVPDVLTAMMEWLEPQTPIVQHRFPSNRWRHYERLARFPEGLAAIGDAVCSVNPTYGQGMTVAAVEAAALDEILRSTSDDGEASPVGRRIQTAIAPVAGAAWKMAAGEDRRYHDEGPRPFPTDLVEWYVGRLHMATWRSARVAQRFYRVMHMLEPPAALFSPSVLFRVLTSFGSRAASPTASPPRPSGPRSRTTPMG